MSFRILFALQSQSQYDTNAFNCLMLLLLFLGLLSHLTRSAQEKRPVADSNFFSRSLSLNVSHSTVSHCCCFFSICSAKSRFSANLICLDIKGVNRVSEAIKGWTFYSKINFQVKTTNVLCVRSQIVSLNGGDRACARSLFLLFCSRYVGHVRRNNGVENAQ